MEDWPGAGNPYGEEKLLPAVSLGEAFLQRGEVRFDIFPLRPLGLFRVEAWVENTTSQRISRVSEIVVNRLHRPRFWGKDAPDSPFGTHLLLLERDIAMAKAIGINWTRLHDLGTDLLGWSYLEPQHAALRAFGAQVTDLWGNSLPDTAQVGNTLVYLTSDQPLSALERVLKNAPAR